VDADAPELRWSADGNSDGGYPCHRGNLVCLPMSPAKKRWREIVYWWSKRSHWLFPLLATLVGILIIVGSGGPKPIGSDPKGPQECGEGLSREIC
jgi:hypothetical protein